MNELPATTAKHREGAAVSTHTRGSELKGVHSTSVLISSVMSSNSCSL